MRRNCIFYLLIFFVLLSCTQEKKTPSQKEAQSINYFDVLEEFQVELPIKYSFQYLKDLSFDGSFLYLCTRNNQYPILKINLITNEIKPIGRMGRGPNEYPLPPNRISAHNNWLLVTDGPRSAFIYLFKDTTMVRRKFFSEGIRVYDVAIVENGKFLIAGAGGSKTYYLLVDSNLTAFYSYPFPPHSTITSAVLSIAWTAQVKPGLDIILHPIHPDVAHIFKKKKNYHVEEIPLRLSDFPCADNALTKNDFYKSIKNPLKLYRKIGKLIWLVMDEGTFQGAFIYGKPTQGRLQNTGVLFVKTNNSLHQKEIELHELTRFIPDKDNLYRYEPILKGNTLLLNIQRVKLKLK